MWQLSQYGGPDLSSHGISLLTGWLPLAVQIVAGLVLLAAIGRRDRRWFAWCLPILALCAGLAVVLFQRYLSGHGLASDPAPAALSIWIGVASSAVLLVALGWRGSRWSRRGLSVLAVPLSLLCVGVSLNDWVGYFPTVTEAWNQLTAGPLPDEVDAAALAGLAGTGASMTTGRLVGVTIPATTSHFNHREEYVYLPPAWFTPSRPQLPVLMMISGEFNTPADWIRVGNAVQIEDDFAAHHQGAAPVVVFVDSGGSFNNDTECVNGPRGNVADYLTKDVPSYLESQFHVATDAAHWGIVGWSAGGTCALDLTVMHPELFGTFDDIAGDLGPNVGDKAATIANLYGGDARAWASFDPLTVLAAHAPYVNTAGWFENSSAIGFGGHGWHGGGPHAGAHPGGPGDLGNRPGGTAGYGGRPDGRDAPGAEAAAATQLCTAARAKGIDCTLHTQDGRHSWQFASAAFSDALPWLASRLGLPAASGSATQQPGQGVASGAVASGQPR